VEQQGAPRKVVEQPASLDVAKLLGLYNVLAVEVRALDPGRNTSTLRFGEWDLEGPYFPGRLRGDRVNLLIRPEYLVARGRDGKLGQNQIAAALERVSERAESARLEFKDGITVVMPRLDYERQKHNKDWVVEFPSAWLRIL
jgi:ABC-type Fe3+/spermidine/putrescine transport system ATPase subunit